MTLFSCENDVIITSRIPRYKYFNAHDHRACTPFNVQGLQVMYFHKHSPWHVFLDLNNRIESNSLNLQLNTLNPVKNGQHFANGIFKIILLKQIFYILIRISLKFLLRIQWMIRLSLYLLSRWASYHKILWSSKPRDSRLGFSIRSEIWQAPRRCDHYNIQSRGVETSRYLTVTSLTA